MTVTLPVASVGHVPVGWGTFGALPPVVTDPLLLPEPEPELPELPELLLPEPEPLPLELLLPATPEPELPPPELLVFAPGWLPLLVAEPELLPATPPPPELPPELPPPPDDDAPPLPADPPGLPNPPLEELEPPQPTAMTIPVGIPNHAHFIFTPLQWNWSSVTIAQPL